VLAVSVIAGDERTPGGILTQQDLPPSAISCTRSAVVTRIYIDHGLTGSNGDLLLDSLNEKHQAQPRRLNPR
jgi:hypothetical protein